MAADRTDIPRDLPAEPYHPTYQRRSGTRGRSARDRKPEYTGAAIAIVVVLVLVVLGAAIELIASAGKIHPGVSVGAVKVGGMSRDRAAATLALRLSEQADSDLAVTYKGSSWPVAADDIDVSFDATALADAAMKVGRSANPVTSLGQRLRAWLGVTIPVVASADTTKLAGVISDIASEIDVQPRDAKLVLDGTDWSLKGAKSGMLVDRPALSTAILAGFSGGPKKVDVPVGVAQAAISDDLAAAAKAQAESMVKTTAAVTWGTRRWDLTAEEIAGMLAFRKTQAAGEASGTYVLEPYVSAAEASKTIAPKLGSDIGHPAVDASFKTRQGAVTIIPSQTGVGPDMELLSSQLTSVLKDPSAVQKVVELHTRKTLPRVTTAMARSMGIKERISTFTTLYIASNKPRVNNIHLLGDALDGKLIAPGDTFSFNGAVGERTAAKGYQEAPAIVQGKLVPQLGGGICQVGTTLFNAAFFSGFPVVERHNHSFYISHYPKGRDATVSWGGPDLKFKNDSKNWVLISVSYSSGSITISLYGTDPGYEVSYETSDFTNIKPFVTETVKDSKIPAGDRVVDDPGEDGRTCVVTRTVTRDGVTVRTDTFKSIYRPKTEVVRLGTKPKSSVTPTDTTN